jgi:hypothetical protein
LYIEAEESTTSRTCRAVSDAGSLPPPVGIPEMVSEDGAKQQKRLAQKGGAMRRMSMAGEGAGRGGRRSRGHSTGTIHVRRPHPSYSSSLLLGCPLVAGLELEAAQVAEVSAAMADAHLSIEPDEEDQEPEKAKPSSGTSSIFGIFKKSEATASQEKTANEMSPGEGEGEGKMEFSFSNDHAAVRRSSDGDPSGSGDRAKQVLQVSKPAMRRVSMAGRGGVDRRSSRDSNRRDSASSTISEAGEEGGGGEQEEAK